MFEKKHDRSEARPGRARGALLLAALVAGIAGMATAIETASESGVLSDVRIERAGEITLVTLVGASADGLTSREESSPHRLVVELARTRAGRLTDRVAVREGGLEEIAIAAEGGETGEARTRVELALAEGARWALTPRADGLEIAVREGTTSAVPAGAPAAEVLPAETTRTETVVPAGDASTGARAPAEATQADAAAPAAIPTIAAAKKLLAVEPRTSADGTIVVLRADGAIESAKSFVLDHPSRLVLDLAGLRSEGAQRRVDVGSAEIDRVRVAQHDDRTRVVIDAAKGAKPFAGHEVVSATSGLVVAVGAEARARAIAVATELGGRGIAGTAQAAPIAGATSDEARATDEVAIEAVSAATAPVATDEAASELATSRSEATSTEILGPVAVASEPSVAVMLPEPATRAPEASVESALPDVAAATPLGASETSEEDGDGEEGDAGAEIDPSAKLRAASNVLRGVQLDAQADRDRVVLVADRALDVELTEPDASTVVLRIAGAAIDPKAQLRIEPEKAGTVKVVSAYEQPGATPEARVLIQRTAGAKARVERQGSIVLIDFAPSTEKIASAPQALPLLTAAEMQIAGGAPVPGPGERLIMASQSVAPAAPAKGATGNLGLLREGGLLEGKSYTGQRISLDLKEVDIDDVLRLVAEVSNLNVIAGDDVSGKVTIRLVEVPWDQALDVILLTKGLGFVRVGNVLRIAPAQLLQQEEESRLQEKRAKEKLEDLQVRLVPVNYADVAEVEKLVKRLLSARGVVNVDKRTSTLIVKDIPSVIREATGLVQAIDSQTPQVLIEAKVVEANLDFSRELGTEWAVGTNAADADGDTQGDLEVGGTEYITSGGSTWPFQTANNVVVSNPITSVANGLLNLSGFVLDERFNVALQLQAAESNGEGKVISSPRVVTLDNREAKIEQGVSIPFQTFENGDAQLEFIDAVLSLTVTPHITSDKSIIMKIEVTKNAPDDSVDTPTGSPAIAKNQAKTETLVKNGQTLVLGGIYTVDKSQNESRVPYLHKIPLLGWAFKSRELRDLRKELLLFVTPRIVESTLPKVASGTP